MRNFVFSSLALLLVSCAHPNYIRVPASSVAPVAPEPESEEIDFPMIDAHAHFHSKENKGATQPSMAMLQEFSESQVVGAVVHLSSKENFTVKVDRSKGLKLAVCAAIVPGQKPKEIEKGLKNKRFQCMKVYLGYVPLYAADPFYHPFYRLAEKYKVPVVFHTGDTFDPKAKVKYAEPLQIDEIALQYPNVKVVIAHMGNPWFQSAAEVVYKNPNVYVDLSALMLGDLSKADPQAIELLVIQPMRWFYYYVENPKKFLFGTDWDLLKVKPYADAVKKAFPKEHWRKIFYENALEVFPFE